MNKALICASQCWRNESTDETSRVLSIILTDGRSSRLNKNLVYESQKAHDVRAFHHGQEISGEFHLTATVTPEGDINELEKEIRSELEHLSVTVPSE